LWSVEPGSLRGGFPFSTLELASPLYSRTRSDSEPYGINRLIWASSRQFTKGLFFRFNPPEPHFRVFCLPLENGPISFSFPSPTRELQLRLYSRHRWGSDAFSSRTHAARRSPQPHCVFVFRRPFFFCALGAPTTRFLHFLLKNFSPVLTANFPSFRSPLRYIKCSFSTHDGRAGLELGGQLSFFPPPQTHSPPTGPDTGLPSSQPSQNSPLSPPKFLRLV